MVTESILQLFTIFFQKLKYNTACPQLSVHFTAVQIAGKLLNEGAKLRLDSDI